MPSVIDLCNDALDKVGHNPITSLNDGNTPANLCKRKWPLVRDRLLRAHPWNFAVTRVITAPTNNPPEWGYAYQHVLPEDCLRVIEVRDFSPTEYTVESNKIHIDTDTVYLKYIRQVTNPDNYDTLFIAAVTALLAFELAEPLTQSNAKKDAAWNEYQELLSEARRIDAQENPVSLYAESSWIEARY